MTALLDAAALVDELVDGGEFTTRYEEALRLLAKHARESAAQAAALDAWRRLAMVAMPYKMRASVPAPDDVSDQKVALRSLRALGIDPATGERVAAEEPR